MNKGILAALMLSILFIAFALRADVTLAQGSQQVRSIKEMVIEAPMGSVYLIYTNVTKSAESAYDAVTGGIIYGMCNQDQNQGFDTNQNWVVQDGVDIPGRLKMDYKTVVMFGGPGANIAVKYYEVAAGLTPVYYGHVIDGYLWFFSNPDVTGQPKQWYGLTMDDYNTGARDLFVIESFKDNQQNVVYIIYGLSWRGTWAGGIYFKQFIYPKILADPNSYVNSYFIGIWHDDKNPGGSGYMDGVPQPNEIWEWGT